MAKIKMINGVAYEIHIERIIIHNVIDSMDVEAKKKPSITFKTCLKFEDKQGNEQIKDGGREDIALSFEMLNYILKENGKSFLDIGNDFINLFEGFIDIKKEHFVSNQKHSAFMALVKESA